MLEKLQILELINILQELNQWIRERRDNNPVADKIQFPKTPSSLSESIAIHLLRERRILENENFEEINPGGRIADITARAGVDLKKIEIKATISDFQHFGINDINAHYLVWINLNNTLRNNEETIDLYILQNPIKYFRIPGRILLNRFLNIAEESIIKYEKFNIIQFLKN